MESPSQITRQLDKLEKLGFIERSLDREDSRRIRLSLTKQALALFAGVEGSFAELLGPALSELEADHREALTTGLSRLVEALQPDGGK
jgi:DNA-binding MarR family transcriptional regulator